MNINLNVVALIYCTVLSCSTSTRSSSLLSNSKLLDFFLVMVINIENVQCCELVNFHRV